MSLCLVGRYVIMYIIISLFTSQCDITSFKSSSAMLSMFWLNDFAIRTFWDIRFLRTVWGNDNIAKLPSLLRKQRLKVIADTFSIKTSASLKCLKPTWSPICNAMIVRPFLLSLKNKKVTKVRPVDITHVLNRAFFRSFG